MGIKLIKKNNEAAAFTLPRDVADAMKLVKGFLEKNKDAIAGEQLVSDADASVGYQLEIAMNVLSDLMANAPKSASKENEALSPKMQQRLKIKAWQEATIKMKGFEEAGYSFLDLWEDGKCTPICVPAEGKETEEAARKAAERMFADFDEYVDVSSDFIPEGGPDGEDLWFPSYALKKDFVKLSTADGLTVLEELSDTLHKVLT